MTIEYDDCMRRVKLIRSRAALRLLQKKSKLLNLI